MGLDKSVHNEFVFSKGIWKYQKMDYGTDFVPKKDQIDEVVTYDRDIMPGFRNKEDLMN